MLRYLSSAHQAIPNCREPLTFDTPPSKPLIGYVTALLSPLIVLLVAGAMQVVPCWNMDMLGYHNISYFN